MSARGCAISITVVFVLGISSPVRADDGPSDRARKAHAVLIAALGITYLVVEFSPINDALSADQCRWCNPPRFDTAARDAFLWHDTKLAAYLGGATGYVAAPVAAVGLLVAASWRHHDWRRRFDDVAPVIEAAIATSLIQHGSKIITARSRPRVQFAAPGSRVPEVEDNVSFWSGHVSLCFSLTVSAGSVASIRGYSLAPVIWATGITIGAATGYLRIASDGHYATDVLMGAAVGSVVGYVWPRLIHPHIRRDLTIAPLPDGVSIAGTF